MMDVLECFLHALRLHWVYFYYLNSLHFVTKGCETNLTALYVQVEFQNKFFAADGHVFAPFAFVKEEDLVT